MVGRVFQVAVVDCESETSEVVLARGNRGIPMLPSLSLVCGKSYLTHVSATAMRAALVKTIVARGIRVTRKQAAFGGFDTRSTNLVVSKNRRMNDRR